MNSIRRNNQPGSLPCPRCGKLIGRQSEQCIYCGLRQPGAYANFPILGELISGNLHFADGIVLVCFLLYALSLVLDLRGALSSGNLLDMLSPTNRSLARLGMGGEVMLQAGAWWTLITATYLHGSVLHVAFNMIWLRRIGAWAETLFGNSRFWIIYTFAGLSGAAISSLMGTSFFVGASGAIFGLFGALLYYGWHRGGTFGSALFRQMLIWAGISLMFGFVMPGVDNWGHLRGLAGGALAALVLGYQERVPQRLWHHVLALVFLAGVLICFGMMVWAYFTWGF